MLLAVACVIVAALLPFTPSWLLTDSFVHKQLGVPMSDVGIVRGDIRMFESAVFVLAAVLLAACGYRQITKSTAMRRRELAYIGDDGRLVYQFKMSNDFR